MKSSGDRVLRMIAVFKFFKAGLLIAVGVGAFRLIHKDVAGLAEHCIEALGLDPGNRFVDAVLNRVSMLSPEQIKNLGLGSFVYAGLFLTEGVGLWLLKRWAEWLTVIITSSLVPVEIYAIWWHPSPVKWVALGVNVAIVIYLIGHMRGQRRGSARRAP